MNHFKRTLAQSERRAERSRVEGKVAYSRMKRNDTKYEPTGNDKVQLKTVEQSTAAR